MLSESKKTLSDTVLICFILKVEGLIFCTGSWDLTAIAKTVKKEKTNIRRKSFNSKGFSGSVNMMFFIVYTNDLFVKGLESKHIKKAPSGAFTTSSMI